MRGVLKGLVFWQGQLQLIRPENRATVLSLISLLSSLYVALTSLLMGWLADIDLRYAFALIGGMIVLACVVLRVDKIGGTIED